MSPPEALPVAGPAQDEFGLLDRLRHGRPADRAPGLPPQPVQLPQRLGAVQPLLGQIAAITVPVRPIPARQCT